MGATTYPVPGTIKSIQRGTMGGNTTATINAVNVNRSLLTYLGRSTTSTTDSAVRIALTNSTTITSVGPGTDTVSWELVEYH